jgi:hypothetical protein
MGEPLGDGATRMEVGGKIIYGGGGGGSPPPQPTTTITESGPSVSNINRTTVNEIPDYLTGASQDLVARGQALTARPYEAFTGSRVSEFSPLMNKAFGRMENQQVAGQIGEATGLAGLAGERAMRAGAGLGTYNPYEMGGFTADAAQQYMNPYMQSVVDIERRKAQEAADRQSAVLSGQAAKTGAFGGSGAALQQRALRRDTAQQLGDIQTQGMGRAYDQGLARFGAEEAMREQSRQFGADYGFRGEQLGLEGLRTGLQASGQLGQLGQQQFAQEMDITKGLGTAGDIQRQREQALLDVGYQDYLTAQKYPYEQLAFQQGLVAGVPYSTTQRTSGQEVTQPGKTISQQVTANPSNMAAGGIVGRYADGGITSLLSDQQIDQRQQMSGISDLARMALQAEEMERAQLRAAQQAMMAQQPQGTVADEEMARIAAIEQGIGGLDVPDDMIVDEGMAGGGIVAFSAGDAIPPLENEIIRNAKIKQRQGLPLTLQESAAMQAIAPVATLPAGIASLQAPAETKAASENQTNNRGTGSSNGILDTIYGQQEGFLRDASAREVAAQKDYREDLEKEGKETGDFAAKARQKIEQRMAGLEGEDRSALESSVLDFGLRLLATKGEKNMAKALASAGLNTLAGHKQAMKDIAAKRDKYDDALTKVDELERGERKGTAKDRRAAILSLGQIDADLSKSMANLAGERGTIAFQMWKEQKADARTQSSRSPDQLALLTKYPAGTEKGDELRKNITFIKQAGGDPTMRRAEYNDLSESLKRQQLLLMGAMRDPAKAALIQEEIKQIKSRMAELTAPDGSSARAGSGTVDTKNPLLGP